MKNKIKYKVIHDEPLISKNEIKSMEDFDKILDKSAAYSSGKVHLPEYKLLYKIFLVGGLSVMSLLLVYKFLLPDPEIKQQSVETINEQLVENRGLNELKKKDEVKKQIPALVANTSKKVEKLKSFEDNRGKNKKTKINIQKSTKKTKEIKSANNNSKAVVKPLQKKVEEKTYKESKVEEKLQIKEESKYIKAKPVKGYAYLYNYFTETLASKNDQRTSDKQGTVMVSFIVNEEGNVIEVKAETSLDHELDLEAVEITKNMPKWTPATLDGVPVSSKLKIPITFKIEQKTAPEKEN